MSVSNPKHRISESVELQGTTERKGLNQVTLHELRDDMIGLQHERREQAQAGARAPHPWGRRRPMGAAGAESMAGKAYGQYIAYHELIIPDSVLSIDYDINAGKEDQITFSSSHIEDPELKVLYCKQIQRILLTLRVTSEALDEQLTLDEREEHSDLSSPVIPYWELLEQIYIQGQKHFRAISGNPNDFEARTNAQDTIKSFTLLLGEISMCKMSDEEYIYRYSPLSPATSVTHYIPDYVSVEDGFRVIMRKEGFDV